MSFLNLLKTPSPLNYLIKRIDPSCFAEQIEFYNKVYPENNFIEILSTEPWKTFTSKIQQFDEVWFYKLPTEFWKELRGCQGYVILRNGRVIDNIITIRN